MKIAAGLLLTFGLSALALAAPPAPRISVEVSAIKQLTFEWSSVPGASRYELWFKANDATPWVEYAEKPAPRTTLTVSVSVHLLDWTQARYQLKACNSSGCSTSNTVRVNRDQKLVAMGFFKPIMASDVSNYGLHLALSADGSTMAVYATEPGDAALDRSVVHVYRKTGSGWQLEARLVPRADGYGLYSEEPIALSADGNLLAVGAQYSIETAEGWITRGEVYLFRRSGTTWRQSQKIAGGDLQEEFGTVVKLDDAGRTLVASHRPDSRTTREGGLEVYRLAAGGDQFVHDTSVPVPRANGEPDRCSHFALSGNGRILWRICGLRTGRPVIYVHESPGFGEIAQVSVPPFAVFVDLTFDGTRAIVDHVDGVTIWRRGPSGWVQEARLTTVVVSEYGGARKVAISRDGMIVAVGNPSEISAGLGPIFPPYQPAAEESGAVVVHERKNGSWVIRRLVKPGSTTNQWAGWTVALGDNGRTLATGAILNSSAATGIDGDRDDESAPMRGAVWLY